MLRQAPHRAWRQLRHTMAAMVNQQQQQQLAFSSSCSSGAADGAAAAAAAAAVADAAQRPRGRRRQLPDDGRGLEDFVRGSGGDSTGSSSSSSTTTSELAAAPPPPPSPRRVFIQTYGCQQNSADSDVVHSVLAAADGGYERAASPDDAGVVLLNTCAIRDNAEARVWGRLRELQALKASRRAPLVVGVLGCMAERLKGQLLDERRLADLVVGPDAYRDLPRILNAVQGGGARGAAAMNVQLSLDETYADILPAARRPLVAAEDGGGGGGVLPSTSAFVSIMRGCNNMCSFCVVPFTRGRERSRPVDSVLREVELLAQQGVREVTLLGQNVNSYADFSHQQQQQQQQQQGEKQQQQQQQQQGEKRAAAAAAAAESREARFSRAYAPGFTSVYVPRRDGAVGFAELLDRVAALNPELRVRFTSPHPKDFTERVLDVIAARPNVCKQLHMPAQAGSDAALARMRRGYTRAAYDALVARARQLVPNVALSTDMIAGFCGESDADHAASVDLLRATRYDNAFLFAYSERDKTHAARHLQDDVPPPVKARRLQELFAAYWEGQRELNAREPGRLHLLLLEGRPRRGGPGALQGRTCTFKRAIIGGGAALPASLADLQQQQQQQQQQQRQQHGSNGSDGAAPPPPPALYAGPTADAGPGDYVAAVVLRVAGRATLLCAPIARTTIGEFAALVGGSAVPSDAQVPAWLRGAADAAAAAAVAAEVADDDDGDVDEAAVGG